MSYKIVATESRRGGTEITLCPSGWEENNILSWPPKLVTRLQRDPVSRPEPNWSQYICLVKKSGIITYEEALEWECAYQKADTDGESELNIISKPRKSLQDIQAPNNFECMFENIENMMPNSTNATNPVVVQLSSNSISSPSPTRMVKTNLFPNNTEKPLWSKFMPNLNRISPVSKANSPGLLDFPVLHIESEQEEMNKKIVALQNDVSEIKQYLLDLHQQQHANTIKIMTMLDNISKELKITKSSQNNLQETSDNKSDNDILSKYILPISNLTILKEMDRELSNDKYLTVMVKHFSSFVGTDGQGRGEVLGKKMAEQLMTRELLTKMSWTGVSRTAGFEKKFAFQTLENVVKMFYKVLAKGDSRWSYEKNEKLFSGALLKHANKRAIAEKEKFEKRQKRREPNSLNSPPPAAEIETSTEEPPRNNDDENTRTIEGLSSLPSNKNGDGEE